MGQVYLADMYEFGKGVAKDLEQAEFWFQKAADQGDEDGIEGLARVAKAK